jgi:hypothetical protein
MSIPEPIQVAIQLWQFSEPYNQKAQLRNRINELNQHLAELQRQISVFVNQHQNKHPRALGRLVAALRRCTFLKPLLTEAENEYRDRVSSWIATEDWVRNNHPSLLEYVPLLDAVDVEQSQKSFRRLEGFLVAQLNQTELQTTTEQKISDTQSNSSPTQETQENKRKIPQAEVEILAGKYIEANKRNKWIIINDIVHATKASKGAVSETFAWKLYIKERERVSPPKSKTSKTPKERQLTSAMLEAIPSKDLPPDIALDHTPEQLWKEIVEAAGPENREQLENCSAENKQDLIDTYRSQKKDTEQESKASRMYNRKMAARREQQHRDNLGY